MAQNWWEQDEVVGGGQRGVVTKSADPLRPGQMTLQGQQIQQNAAELNLLPVQADIARAQAIKAEADARAAQANAQGAGQIKAAELNQQDEYSRRRAKVDAATQQAQAMEGLFKDYVGGGVLGSLAEYLPTSENRAFDRTADGLAALLKPIFKVQGEGSFTDRDAADLAGANKPSSWAMDSENRAKLDTVRRSIDAERGALGLPPVEWDKPITPATEKLDASTQRVRSDESAAQTTLSRKTKSVEDPTLKAVGLQVGRMVAGGVSDENILSFLKKAGVDPATTNIGATLKYRRSNPEYKAWKRQNPKEPFPIGREFDQQEVPIEGLENAVNSAAQSAYGAGTIGFANGFTGNRLDEIAERLGSNPERVRAGVELMQEQNPGLSMLGDMGGQMTAEALLGRIPGARALMASQWGRRGTDAAMGAFSGSGANEEDPLSGALNGGFVNTLGGGAGRRVQRGATTAIEGVKDEGLRYLTEKGVDLTVGDIARASDSLPGRAVAFTEDRMAGLPGPDALVKTAKYRGGESFNRAMFNEAAEPVGANIAQTGEQGLEQLSKAEREQYNKVLGKVRLVRDEPFGAELAAARAEASQIPELGNQADYLIARAESLFSDDAITGPRLQDAVRILRKGKSKFASQPLGDDAANALQKAEDALFGLAGRQAPEIADGLSRANQVHTRKKIIQRGMRNRPAQRNDSLVSPEDLNAASIQNTTKYGGEDLALSSGRPFYKLTNAAMDAMGPTLPDSGTAGRAMLVPALGGLLAAGGQAPGLGGQGSSYETGGDVGTGLGLLTLLASGAYSKGGQKMLQKALLSDRPGWLHDVGEWLVKRPNAAGRPSAAAARSYFSAE